MTTHETLKIICDMIGYEIPKYIWDYNGELVRNQDYGDGGVAIIDEREIIFTHEFMEKFETALGKTIFPEMVLRIFKERGYLGFFRNELLNNLHDPTSYLANLLGIGQKN